jgi:hypothetical protein
VANNAKTLRRVAQQPARHPRGQVTATALEIAVHRFRQRAAVEVFLEALQQAVIDPAHDRGAAVEALHHLLDAQRVAVVGVAQACGQQLLVVEAQAFFAAPATRCRP